MFKNSLFIFLLFITNLGYSQLSDFNLNVIPTHETCTGNGSLAMQVSGTTSGAEIVYRLYLAPDFTNAIAETTLNLFGSLPSGDYRVVATQTLGGLSNTHQQDVVIQDLVVDLDFQLSHSVVTNCDVTGTITVGVLSGNATFFEIISGPIIVPQQTSNVFSGLTSGTYVVRVYDDCGDALSKTYTMLLSTNNLEISPSVLPAIYDVCDSATITTNINSISGAAIVYPLEVTFTINPPDGSPAQIIIINYATGPPVTFDISQVIPLFGNLPFMMSVSISDVCGNVFQTETQINPNPITKITPKPAPPCGMSFLTLAIKGFMPPYNVNFTTFPDGFVPNDFNADYPGPFNESPIDFGDEENPVPFGNYIVTVQDACGRTSVVEFLLEDVPLEPLASSANNGCASVLGMVRIQIPEDRLIVSVIIIAAPDAYVPDLPSNVSSFIDAEGIFFMQNLPVGDYIFTVIDDCGDEYTIEVNVPEFEETGLYVIVKPNCDPGTGSVRISSSNGAMSTMMMTAAPLTYMQNLPYDVSFNLNASGVFFMSDLPAGNYTFQTIDGCGFNVETSVEIMGYESMAGYNLNRHCGAFDLEIFDEDLLVTGQSYWFQKFYPTTNTWGHPYTGAAYTEGEVPDSTNAFELINFETVYNIFLTGDFRVIKAFQSFNNGGSNTNCLDIFASFNISSKLIISGAYSLDCAGGSGISDVVLDVIGVASYNFSIVEPFVFDNGDNNVFSGLSPGVYLIKVEDACGNIENIEVEVGNLLPLARANEPQSMLVCRNDGVEFGVFILTDQDIQILGNQDPNIYDVTYHISQADANTGDNPLSNAYTNVTNPQTIYVRVAHKTIDLCYATTSFNIFIGNNPVLSPEETFFICQGNAKILIADPGFTGYEWSTGETTQSIVVSEPGIYNVIVKNVYDDFSCDATKNFTVIGSGIATFQNIDTSDWTSSSNTISVFVSGIGDYEYSLDNINFQDSNVFTDLIPGTYTVYVRDKKGCGTIMDEFVLLNYPNFFTPNGDGYNDTWHIKLASFEPELKINIFDRYGKFLTQLKGQGPGWDGKFNGKQLPSTDYWFVANRADGKTYKGHFALKR